jgi:hypothetical protein
VFQGAKKNKGLDIKRLATSALVAALEDEKAQLQPQQREHRSGGTRVILTGAALAAAGGLAWKAARGRLPDLSDLKGRALDRLDDLGLLDDDNAPDGDDLVDEDVDDYVDDEDDEPYEDEDEEEDDDEVEEDDDDDDDDDDDYYYDDEDDEEAAERESVVED